MLMAQVVVKDNSNSWCISLVWRDTNHDNLYFLQACLEGTKIAWSLDYLIEHVEPTTQLDDYWLCDIENKPIVENICELVCQAILFLSLQEM